MDNSIEWVLPGDRAVIVCLMPIYTGMLVETFMHHWSIPTEAKVYSWNEQLTPDTPLKYGMRLHVVMPIQVDPKQQRHLLVRSLVSKKSTSKK